MIKERVRGCASLRLRRGVGARFTPLTFEQTESADESADESDLFFRDFGFHSRTRQERHAFRPSCHSGRRLKRSWILEGSQVSFSPLRCPMSARVCVCAKESRLTAWIDKTRRLLPTIIFQIKFARMWQIIASQCLLSLRHFLRKSIVSFKD
jgi:hypothetical protein